MKAEHPPTPWRYYLAAAGLWALLFVLLSALAVTYEVRRLERDFLRSASHVQQRILQAITVSDSVLDGLSLALSNMDETDLRFERYARHILVLHDHLQMVQVVRRVGAEELDTFLARMRQVYGPEFSLRPWDAADLQGSVEPAKAYYPITFVAPHGPAAADLLGRDLGSNPTLRRPLLLALSAGDPSASPPIELPAGGVGYCVFLSDFQEGGRAAGLIVRADRLLTGPPRAGFRVALRYANRKEVIIAQAEPRGRLAALLLPEHRDVRAVDGPERPFSLVLEHTVDWRDLSPAPMIPLLALALLGLPAALATAHRRHLFEYQRAAHEELLAHRATHDPLTELPNRQLVRDRFAHACRLAERRGTQVGLLFLDLDNFKQLNDRHGHEFGDAALRTTAARLAGAVRKGDTVARIGGDEFLVLLEGIAGMANAREAAEHILEALEPPARFHGVDYRIESSIGIALFPQDGTDFDSLLASADEAMYRAKRAGGGRYERQRR